MISREYSNIKNNTSISAKTSEANSEIPIVKLENVFFMIK